MAKQKTNKHKTGTTGWLLFFYSVPSRPVNNRMRIWRKLIKSGAVQFKGAVYILPYCEENHEFFMWLASEVAFMKGESAFIRTDAIETMDDNEIIAVFNRQRERDYGNVQKHIDELEIKTNSIQKGAGIQNIKKLLEHLAKYSKEFEEVKKIDFFSSKAGVILHKKIESLKAALKNISGAKTDKQPPSIIPRRIEDYHSRMWATRKNPFVDRMASAWLIKKLIDSKASFKFIDERDLNDLGKEIVTFDIRSGEFTHIGDMCTFEVLVKSFGIKDRAVKKIAWIVHDIDIKDDKYTAPEAKGIEEILTGIRKAAKGDADALERGMAVFEMLYASKT